MADQARKGGKKNRKIGRNKAKCEKYRQRIGLPNGPGVSGNKAGKHHVVVDVKRRDALRGGKR